MIQLLWHKIWFHLPVLVIGILLTIFFTFPAVLNLDTHYIGDGGDNYQYAGFQYLIASNLSAKQWPYTPTQAWRYPGGFEFDRGYDSVLSTLGGGLLLKQIQKSAYTYNLTILLSFLFNFWGGYLLFQKASRSRAWAVIGAVAFGFSFYTLARAGGHANLLLIGGFPLLIYAVWRWLEKPNWSNMLLIIIGEILLIFSSLQYVSLLAAGLLIFLPVSVFFYPRLFQKYFKLFKKYWEQWAISTFLVLVVTLPFLNPLIKAYLSHDYIGRGSGENFSPSIFELILPNKYLPVTLSQLNPARLTPYAIEQAVAIGPVVLLLFLLGVIYFWRKKTMWFLLTLSGIFLVIMAGTINHETGLILPYTFLQKIPPFAMIPESGRYVVLLLIAMLMLIVKAGPKFTTDKSSRLIATGVLLFGLMLERSTWGKFFLQPIPDNTFAQAVQQQPGQAVLDIPLFEQKQSILPIYYHKAVLTGEPHWLANTESSLAFLRSQPILANLACMSQAHLTGITRQTPHFTQDEIQQFFQYLKTKNIETIVVHRDARLYWEDCLNVLAIETQLVPQFVTAQPSASDQDSEAHLRWSGQSFTGGLYFPQSGTVTLLGISYAPTDREKVSLSLNDQLLNTETWPQTFSLREDGQTQVMVDMNRIREGRLNVPAGSKLVLSIPKSTTARGFVTLWYRYQPDPKSQVIELRQDGLVKVYQDKARDVWRIE